MTDYKAMAKQTIREIEDRKRKEKATNDRNLEAYNRIREARMKYRRG